MPYIPEDRRDDALFHPTSAGELNYSITKRLSTYIHERGLSYQTVNDVIGALDAAKAEFYRRVAAPYEDAKIEMNGDVY